MSLWNNEIEIEFFRASLRNFASPEQLFYKLNSGYYAYVPSEIEGEGQTLQSRNSLIGKFTENWSKSIFDPIAKELGLYAVNDVVCEKLSLSARSSADLALCTTNDSNQIPENIKLLFEIKMSIVSNYKFTTPDNIEYISDYKKHKGTPALLRSDSMLKAIGKAINIRVSGIESTKIPIIILGNSPIQTSYSKKVDFLKMSGVIQGFWSLNPNPTSSNFIKNTPKLGFQTILNTNTLLKHCEELIKVDMNYFSSMISTKELGALIKIASQETDDISKATKFLTLIRQ